MSQSRISVLQERVEHYSGYELEAMDAEDILRAVDAVTGPEQQYDPDALLSTPQIHTDDEGVHRDAQGREYVAVEVDGEVDFEMAGQFAAGRVQGIRDAAAYITRVGRLLGSNEYRLKSGGVPEFLRELADAVEAGVVKL